MQKRSFEVGLMVEHQKFGRGEVLKIYGDFRDVWFHQMGVAKRIREDHLTVSADQVRVARRKIRPASTTQAAKPKKTPHQPYAWDETLDAFVAAFPLAFDDPAYLAAERSFKAEACERATEMIKATGFLHAGVHGKDGARAADALRQMLPQAPKNKAALLSPFEFIALQAALNDGEAAIRLGEAVLMLLDSPDDDEIALARYFEAVVSLPSNAKNNPAKWPVATIFPFVAAPGRHMFLKPVATRSVAAALGMDFDYTPSLNASTYRSLLALTRRLHEKLSERFPEHPPKDNIDLQSFIVWCQDRK